MKEFDEFFKSALADQEAKVPDDMWSRIEAAQDPNGSARKKRVYILLGAFLMLLISTTFTYINWTSTESLNSEEVIVGDKLTASIVDSDSFKSLLLPNNDIITADEQLKGDIQILAKGEREGDVEVASSSILNGTSATSASPFESELSERIVNTELLLLNQIDQEELLQNKTELIGTTLLPEKLNKLIINQKPSFLALPDYDKKCPKFGRKSRGYFSIEGLHASDYNLKNLNTKGEEFTNYQESRTLTEKNLYSFSNRLLLRWQSYNGLSIGAGVERSTIREQFNYIEKGARKVNTVILIDTLFLPDGSKEVSRDTTRIELVGTMENKILNKYTSIDLPINLGYKFELKRWAIGINAGVNINLLFTQKGRILDAFGAPAWITTGSKNELNIFRPKSGLKFDGSLSVLYHLTDRLDIMAEPYFRYNPNSFSRSDYQLDLRYNTIGIRTGIKYNLGF